MALPININMNTLIRLADKDVEQQVADFGALPIDIKESLERQMAERRKEVVDAAAEEIVNLLGFKDQFITSLIQANAGLQAQIDANNKLLEKVSLQTQYGLQTQNFLPLAKQLGQPVASAKADLTKIPESWTPAVAPVATTAAPAATAPAA